MASKITIGDLDETVTIREVLAMLEEMKDEQASDVMAAVEHWTDGEGLHYVPFEKALDSDFEERIQENVACLVRGDFARGF